MVPGWLPPWISTAEWPRVERLVLSDPRSARPSATDLVHLGRMLRTMHAPAEERRTWRQWMAMAVAGPVAGVLGDATLSLSGELAEHLRQCRGDEPSPGDWLELLRTRDDLACLDAAWMTPWTARPPVEEALESARDNHATLLEACAETDAFLVARTGEAADALEDVPASPRGTLRMLEDMAREEPAAPWLLPLHPHLKALRGARVRREAPRAAAAGGPGDIGSWTLEGGMVVKATRLANGRIRLVLRAEAGAQDPGASALLLYWGPGGGGSIPLEPDGPLAWTTVVQEAHAVLDATRMRVESAAG